MHLISRRCSISYHLLPVLIIIRIMFKPRRTGMTVIQGTARAIISLGLGDNEAVYGNGFQSFSSNWKMDSTGFPKWRAIFKANIVEGR